MFKKLKRNLKIFLLFSYQSLKTTGQSRQAIFLFTLGKILRFVFLFGVIFLVFSKTKIIAGWSLKQVVILYLTFNFIDTFSQVLYREVYRFRPQVISGNLDLILVKPYHPFLRVLVGGVDFLDLLLLVPYFFLLLFFIFQEKISFFSFFLYLTLVINGLIIATAFHIFVLALGLLTTEVDNAIMIYRDILNLGRFPIEIYQQIISFIFTFIIPIGVMITFPVKALFHFLSLKNIIFSFFISFFLLLLSIKSWQIGLKKYQSAGG
jgi:ABC-2 type transport system permease protein